MNPRPLRHRLTLATLVTFGRALLAGPVRDRVARTRQIEECEGDRRCPVSPVARTVPLGAAKPAHKH